MTVLLFYKLAKIFIENLSLMKTQVHIHCASGRCLDKEPSMILAVGKTRYIIEAPDNLSRNFLSNYFKPDDVAAIFTTRLFPYSVGISSFSDVIQKKVPIIGPSELNNMSSLLGESYGMLKNSYEDQKINVQVLKLSKSLSFIVNIKEIPGGFCYEMAKSLGVADETQIKKLSKRETVILPDGTEILSLIHI